MPVASDKRKVIYTTTTGQTQFSFQTGGTNIPLNAAADLLIKVSTDNYPLNPSLYTVTGSNATGWTLTLLTALPAGSVVTLYRQTTMLNTTDFQENARMFPDTLDATIDRLTMRDIEQQEQLERSMSQSIEDESDAFVFPNREGAKGKFLYFNVATGDMEAQPVSGVYMTLDTEQTVDEVKTFTKSPIVPTPATDMQASTKKYVDDNVPTRGTYTPTLTNGANISASQSFVSYWFKVGPYVTVFGQVDIDITTGTTDSILEMSIPIASDFAGPSQMAGSATSNVSAWRVYASVTNDRAIFRNAIQTAVSNANFSFMFTYQVV